MQCLSRDLKINCRLCYCSGAFPVGSRISCPAYMVNISWQTDVWDLLLFASGNPMSACFSLAPTPLLLPHTHHTRVGKEDGHVGCLTSPTAPHFATYSLCLFDSEPPSGRNNISFHHMTALYFEKAIFLGGCGRFPFITSFLTRCSSTKLRSLARMFSLRCCHDILAGIPGDFPTQGLSYDMYEISFFFLYQPYLTHMSPGGLWTYCSNHSVSILSGDSLSRFPLSFKNQ